MVTSEVRTEVISCVYRFREVIATLSVFSTLIL